MQVLRPGDKSCVCVCVCLNMYELVRGNFCSAGGRLGDIAVVTHAKCERIVQVWDFVFCSIIPGIERFRLTFGLCFKNTA